MRCDRFSIRAYETTFGCVQLYRCLRVCRATILDGGQGRGWCSREMRWKTRGLSVTGALAWKDRMRSCSYPQLTAVLSISHYLTACIHGDYRLAHVDMSRHDRDVFYLLATTSFPAGFDYVHPRAAFASISPAVHRLHQDQVRAGAYVEITSNANHVVVRSGAYKLLTVGLL